MGRFNFIDGLKSLVSSMTNDRNPINSNSIVSSRVLPNELRAIYKSGLGNKIIRVKAGYALKNELSFEDEQDGDFYKKKLSKHVKLASRFMLAFGRCIIVINERGADLSTPANSAPDNYKLEVFSGDMVTAYDSSLDLSNDRYMRPQMYTVRGFQFHHSRVIDFRYITPPEIDLPVYQYGGISEFELIYNQLVNDGIVERASAAIVDKNSSFFYKIKGFKEVLQSGNEADMLNFYRITENSRSIFGAGLIDGEDDVVTVNQTLTDLDKVDEITLRRLAMVTSIPMALLIGESVKGMNSTGETEKQVFNEMIEIIQEDYLLEPINELMTKLGKGEVSFPENQNQTPLDQVSFDKTVLENAVLLFNMGEDHGKYLLDKGVTEKDNFEEMFADDFDELTEEQ